MDALRPNSPYPRTPVYGGRTPESRVVTSGAGGLRKATGPLSLPLSPISGAGGSIGLQRAWIVEYTPLVVTRRVGAAPCGHPRGDGDISP